MKTKSKIPVEKTLGWGLRKFGHWFKIYRHIVEKTQREMGGKLHIFGEEHQVLPEHFRR